MLQRRLEDIEKSHRKQTETIYHHSAQIAELQANHAASTLLLSEIRATQKDDSSRLTEHVLQEAKDRTRLLIGIFTAVFSTLGTLGLLLWAILEKGF
jgi:hypothetical protein